MRPSDLYMTTAQEENHKGDTIELDFLRVLKIDVFGTLFRAWVDVSFIRAGDKKAACVLRVLLDTAHSLFWINEEIYKQACNEKSGTPCEKRLGKFVSFYYGKMKERVTGELYESDVALGNVIIERQVFAVVNESSQPRVKRWREEDDVIGVLGIGPESATKDLVKGHPNMTIRSVGDALLKKTAPIIGMCIKIPNAGAIEGTTSASSPVVRGELHFGGFKRSSFSPKEPIWSPASKHTNVAHYTFPVDIKITCGKTILIDTYPAFIDTGCPFLIVPMKVIQRYREEVQKDCIGGGKIIHWDSNVSAFYVLGSDLDKLKDIRVHLDGAVPDAGLTFSKSELIIQSRAYRQWNPRARDGCWYVLMLGAKINFIVLGLYWRASLLILSFFGCDELTRVAERHCYIIKDVTDPDNAKIGIAER